MQAHVGNHMGILLLVYLCIVQEVIWDTAQRLLFRLPLGTLTTMSGLSTSITGAAKSANRRVQYPTREAVAACEMSFRQTVRSLILRHNLPKLPAVKTHRHS